jgi:hypothetical protein
MVNKLENFINWLEMIVIILLSLVPEVAVSKPSQ